MERIEVTWIEPADWAAKLAEYMAIWVNRGGTSTLPSDVARATLAQAAAKLAMSHELPDASKSKRAK